LTRGDVSRAIVLAAWIKHKFKRFHRRLGRAREFLAKIARESPRLFVHWQLGASGKPA
jgi:RNA-directed DNA polymerase